MVNASASLSAACVAARGHLCLFAPHLLPFIRTPLLALNSKFDASMGRGPYNREGEAPAKCAGVWRLRYPPPFPPSHPTTPFLDTDSYNCTPYLGVPCDASSVEAFGDYVARSMRRLLRPPHGAYLDACFRHCSTNDQSYNIHMAGTDAAHAAADWYAHGSALPNGGFWEQEGKFRCDACCA